MESEFSNIFVVILTERKKESEKERKKERKKESYDL